MTSADRGSVPKPEKGASGPDDKGHGTGHKPHADTGNNKSPGTGTSGHTQWKPGAK